MGFVVPRRSGGFVIGKDKCVVHFEWGKEKHTILHEVDHGKESRFNDGKCDPSGRLFCGELRTDHNL